MLISLVSGVVGVILSTLFGWLGSYVVFQHVRRTVAFPFEWTRPTASCWVCTAASLTPACFQHDDAVKHPPVSACRSPGVLNERFWP